MRVSPFSNTIFSQYQHPPYIGFVAPFVVNEIIIIILKFIKQERSQKSTQYIIEFDIICAESGQSRIHLTGVRLLFCAL